ncbi:MAG: hypothetical protein ACOX04_04840 [Candidatus Scatomorpha sp.]|jgi:hypothetical protein
MIEMWILFGFLCLVTTVLNLVWTLKKKHKAANWAAFGSLCFLAFELLSEYYLISKCVLSSDWDAICETVPYMMNILIGFTVIILSINALLLIIRCRAHETDIPV